MTIETLYKLFINSSGISTDTRKISPNNLFFALSGDNFNGNKFAHDALKKGACYAVIDDENFNLHNGKTIFVNNTLDTLQQLASYHREQLNIPIISLTGSNGKTTTKELIRDVLAQQYNVKATIGNLNNHIGVPLTLLSMSNDTEIGIVELGANHQKEIEALCKIAKPDYGYITNFGKAHLEGFGGIEGVIKGKSELYDYLRLNSKHAFVNEEDQIQVEKSDKINTSYFSQNNTSDCCIKLINANPNVNLNYNNLTIKSNLIGSYNFPNISAAICIGQHFNISPEAIKLAIERYIPENNRSQIIKTDSNTIILDAYNANPSSMTVALENLSKQSAENKIAILGDMFELGTESTIEHQNITNLAEELNFTNTVLIGEHFFKSITSKNTTSQHKTFEDFKAAFKTKPNHSTILIKGSRGMALERIIELLKH